MLSDNLKVLRKIYQYTQEQLAETLGISRQAVAKWESGETVPDINNCMALAKLYDVTLDDLVNYDKAQEGILIPPKGKHVFGKVTIDEAHRITLPEKALTMFEMAPGDEILIFGADGEGIALVKKEVFLRNMSHFYREIGEE